jgi:Fic family protein
MQRSGTYVKQLTGYRTFMPASLPPKPAVRIECELQNLLSRADMALARLDGVAEMLPNVDLFIAMYVKKEALLSSQIEK